MKVLLNGQEFHPSKDKSCILDLLNEKGIDSNMPGIALCLNLEVIPKEQWGQTALQDGDRIDLVVAAPGG